MELEIFNKLDANRKGYLEVEEVKCFYEENVQEVVEYSLVQTALKLTNVGEGKTGERCTPSNFPPVITKIDELHQLSERISWEFRALDRKRRGRIKVTDALVLFGSVLGRGFSLAAWYSFLSERGNSSADVILDEIKPYLMRQLAGHPATVEEYLSTEHELQKRLLQREHKRYTAMTAGRTRINRQHELEEKAREREHNLQSGGLDVFQSWINPIADTGQHAGAYLQEQLHQKYASPEKAMLENAVFGGKP